MQPGQPYGMPHPAARTGEERVLAGICHLCYVLVIFPVIIPLIVWLAAGNRSPYIKFHAVQTLLAHIAPTVLLVVGIITAILLVGIPILLIAIVLYLVLWFVELVGAIVCFTGGDFRIPLFAEWTDDLLR